MRPLARARLDRMIGRWHRFLRIFPHVKIAVINPDWQTPPQLDANRVGKYIATECWLGRDLVVLFIWWEK